MASTDLVGSVKDLVGLADQKKVRTIGKEMGKDAFLQLLVTQLKNQDPMKPMENTAMIAEMAQFSSLEQMQNLNKTMEKQQTFASLTQASGMIGKYVSLQMPGEEGTIVSGLVSEVRSSGGTASVVIDGEPYDANNIMKVSDKPFTGTTMALPKALASTATTAAATTAAAAAAAAAAATPATTS